MSRLCKRYGDRLAVDGVELRARAGEIVGLIGTNGAGRTTTVECIQGLRRPEAGTLRVLGLDLLPTVRPSAASSVANSRTPHCPTGCASGGRRTVRFHSPGGDGSALFEEFGLLARRPSPLLRSVAANANGSSSCWHC